MHRAVSWTAQLRYDVVHLVCFFLLLGCSPVNRWWTNDTLPLSTILMLILNRLDNKTGFIMDFISAPVISGFCSAAAVTVILSQFKTILGLSFRGSTFTKVLPGIFKYWRSIRVWDAVLGFAFIAFLMLLKVGEYFPDFLD